MKKQYLYLYLYLKVFRVFVFVFKYFWEREYLYMYLYLKTFQVFVFKHIFVYLNPALLSSSASSTLFYMRPKFPVLYLTQTAVTQLISLNSHIAYVKKMKAKWSYVLQDKVKEYCDLWNLVGMGKSSVDMPTRSQTNS